MNRTTDVIVIGSGLSGLMAAYAAAKQNKHVKVISEGMGALAISSGCIDVLGYDGKGNKLATPYAGFAQLAPDHPYALLGQANVEEALDELVRALSARGLELHIGKQDGKEANTPMPTIMGTLKPSWLVPKEVEADALAKAQKILIVSVKGFRDCRPALIASQLSRYPELADKDFATIVLPSPFAEHGRSLNALDLAHMADRPKGRDWLVDQIKGIGKKHDLALLPPILGARAHSGIRKLAVESIGCPIIELLSVPPGVAGLRMRDALVNTLVELGVEFYENAQITSAEVQDGICKSVTVTATNRQTTQAAGAYVIATGGIISGGVILEQGKAHEAIFGIDLPVPADVDEWSEPEVFGRHLVSRLGVQVDASLNLADGSLKNVFFAGRTIGGYDQAAEKSGHGVAVATGWHAGKKAAAHVADSAQKAAGGNI